MIEIQAEAASRHHHQMWLPLIIPYCATVFVITFTTLSVTATATASVSDVARISPYTDGHLLDSSVKTKHFLWMKTHYHDKEIAVEHQNTTQEFTLLLNLEGVAVPPFSGNITTSREEFANIRINDETTTSLTLLQEYPWRKVLMYLLIKESTYLNCDLDFRLHSNTTYNLVIQGYFYDTETLLFVYMNGKLLQKCRYEGKSFNKIKDSENKTKSQSQKNSLLLYTLENKPEAIILSHRVVYWPRALSYHEVQQISLLPSPFASIPSSISQLNSPLATFPTSASTWYRDALDRYPKSAVSMQASTSTAQVCIHETIAVILYPGFYSGKVTNKLYSVQWLQKHILDSLQHTLYSLTLCSDGNDNGQVVIYIPLTHQHRMYVEKYVLDHLHLPQDADEVSIEFYTIPATLKPLSHKLDNLTVTYAFASVANALLEEITSSAAAATPDGDQVEYIGVLFTYIYPEKNWLVGLIEGGLGDDSADIVGGKIVHMSGVLVHYGYELLELSFNGGLDVMLTPHNMYR